MYKYFLTLTIAALLLSACIPSAAPTDESTPPAAEQKSGFTSVSGTVKANGPSTAIIQTASGSVPVETYAVDFTQYEGQTVTATGKYSGDTLFISEIQVSQ